MLVAADLLPVLVAADQSPVLVAADMLPVLVAAEQSPVLVAADMLPVLVAAEQLPVLVAAEQSPVLVSLLSFHFTRFNMNCTPAFIRPFRPISALTFKCVQQSLSLFDLSKSPLPSTSQNLFGVPVSSHGA